MNHLTLGSSKTLDEAISRIVCLRPPEGMSVQHWVEDVLRDYMAPKFHLAMAKSHTPEQEAMILDLWKSIFPERG